MRRWAVTVVLGLLAFGSARPVQAQLPSSGSTGMKYVPINTSQNLAAPVPLMPVPPKKSFFSRVRSSLASLNPFASDKTPNTAPMAPTTKLPKHLQAQSNTGSKLPEIPKVPDLVSGTVK